MFGLEEGDFFFGITWQKVLAHAIISLTATALAWWVLTKYGKWPRR